MSVQDPEAWKGIIQYGLVDGVPYEGYLYDLAAAVGQAPEAPGLVRFLQYCLGARLPSDLVDSICAFVEPASCCSGCSGCEWTRRSKRKRAHPYGQVLLLRCGHSIRASCLQMQALKHWTEVTPERARGTRDVFRFKADAPVVIGPTSRAGAGSGCGAGAGAGAGAERRLRVPPDFCPLCSVPEIAGALAPLVALMPNLRFAVSREPRGTVTLKAGLVGDMVIDAEGRFSINFEDGSQVAGLGTLEHVEANIRCCCTPAGSLCGDHSTRLPRPWSFYRAVHEASQPLGEWNSRFV